MSFLNPVALWLLLVVPLVFLARRRPVRQRVQVSNLYLWNVPTPTGTSALTRRFRRHRLFLLQALVLVALILAIARPLLSFTTRSVVVIIDVSLSMGARDGARTRLDAAKAQAVSFVAALPWNASVRIVTAAAAPRDLGEFSSATLEAIRASVESSDVGAAIQLARSLAEPPDQIQVFSDLSSPIPSGLSDVGWSQIGTPTDNVAVTALGVLRRPREAYASVAVTNFSGAVVSRTVVLEQGGRAIASEGLEIAPGRTQTVNAVASLADGILTARIDGDDALPEDNQRRAIVPSLRRLRVRLTGGAFFLEHALRAHPDVELTVGPAPGDDDVVVCGGCAELPAGNTSVLLIPPTGDLQGPTAMTGVMDHPLLDGIGLADISIAPVAMRGEARDGTVLATAGDLPAIVAYNTEARRVIEWRFDVSNGAVPLSPAFPLLVANAIDWLSGEGERPSASSESASFVNPDTKNESDLRTTRKASIPSMAGEPSRAGNGPGGRNEITALLVLLALGALMIEWRHRRAAVPQV